MTLRDPLNKVVTVFGGSGFIGRHLINRLAYRGWTIQVATRHPTTALSLKLAGSVGQIVPIYSNLCKEATVAAAVAKADIVVNLVGILYENRWQRFSTIHHEGAERVARLSKVAGVERLIHLSAIGANRESRSTYACTKAFGEQAVRSTFPQATILRPSIVFGPEDNFFNCIAGLARLTPVLPLVSGSKTCFQPVYVGDVAQAIMSSIDSSTAAGKTYELGGPRIFTLAEMIQLTLYHSGQNRFLLPLPWILSKIAAHVFSLLPKPILTLDQLYQLSDNKVVSNGALSLIDLGITPTKVDKILPTYLNRFKSAKRLVV